MDSVRLATFNVQRWHFRYRVDSDQSVRDGATVDGLSRSLADASNAVHEVVRHSMPARAKPYPGASFGGVLDRPSASNHYADVTDVQA